jgi:hypothetical protein
MCENPYQTETKTKTAKKAGKPASPQEQQEAFLESLLHLNVNVLHTGSRRISKVVLGERPIESLLEKGVG